MSRDKQIEEMAADIRFNMQIQPNPKEHPSHQLARLLVKDGYCKASDLAAEIFAEIEKLFFANGVFIHIQSYNELKKKYTEDTE